MPSVLIADDAAFMRMMIKNILTDAGYEIVGEAENGAVAVTKYRELKPDLTTMDITMPEMDGLAALKEIRGQDPEARVVMCSAMGPAVDGDRVDPGGGARLHRQAPSSPIACSRPSRRPWPSSAGRCLPRHPGDPASSSATTLPLLRRVITDMAHRRRPHGRRRGPRRHRARREGHRPQAGRHHPRRRDAPPQRPRGALRELMKVRPTPVVMVSSLTGKNSAETSAALASGAIDVVEKPALRLSPQRAGARPATRWSRRSARRRHGPAPRHWRAPCGPRSRARASPPVRRAAAATW